MLKLKSGDGLVGLLKKNKRLLGIAVVLILGVVLIILGTSGLGKDGGEGAVAESEEERLSKLCSEIDGVGECRVMITANSKGEVLSAVIVCRGASDIEVRRALVETVTSLYGIGSNRVSITKMKNK